MFFDCFALDKGTACYDATACYETKTVVPQSLPGYPKRLLRSSEAAPATPRAPKTPQDHPRPPQDCPKTAPRPPQDCPKTAHSPPQDRPSVHLEVSPSLSRLLRSPPRRATGLEYLVHETNARFKVCSTFGERITAHWYWRFRMVFYRG